MRLLPRLLSLVFLITGAGMCAQQVRETPPAYAGPFTLVPGVFVTPIGGAPFSATVVIKSQQPLSDGTVDTRVTQTLIARDSKGRIRNERHMLVPEGYSGYAAADRGACLRSRNADQLHLQSGDDDCPAAVGAAALTTAWHERGQDRGSGLYHAERHAGQGHADLARGSRAGEWDGQDRNGD